MCSTPRTVRCGKFQRAPVARQLVGCLGGGGLGLKLYNAIQLGFHDQVCTMVLVIFGLVVLSDGLSDSLRRSWLSPAALRRETGRAVGPWLAARGRVRWTAPPERLASASRPAEAPGEVPRRGAPHLVTSEVPDTS